VGTCIVVAPEGVPDCSAAWQRAVPQSTAQAVASRIIVKVFMISPW
jgi:hypothetical protein